MSLFLNQKRSFLIQSSICFNNNNNYDNLYGAVTADPPVEGKCRVYTGKRSTFLCSVYTGTWFTLIRVP